ncbi:hypothetical protein HDU92_004852 [Lobulomyces angularis]|nr:hypothetical protein HDU92_004852 [Lobulomyces angularis]
MVPQNSKLIRRDFNITIPESINIPTVWLICCGCVSRRFKSPQSFRTQQFPVQKSTPKSTPSSKIDNNSNKTVVQPDFSTNNTENANSNFDVSGTSNFPAIAPIQPLAPIVPISKIDNTSASTVRNYTTSVYNAPSTARTPQNDELSEYVRIAYDKS